MTINSSPRAVEDALARAAEVNPARSFTGFLSCLEEGQLANELTRHLEQIHAALSNHIMDHGGEPKATLKLTLSIKARKGVFDVDAAVAVTTPTAPRDRTTLWGTADGRFTPNNPKQLNMFRDVNS